jgi:membrane protein YqaA with SNARE-associated domain
MPPPDSQAAAPAPAPPPELDIRRIVRLTLISVLLLMVALGIVAYAFAEPLKALSVDFVDTLRGPGVALGFLLPDGFTIPLPNDAFTVLGLAGGMGFWEVVAWGFLGSIAGGCIGFTIGRLLQRTRWFSAVMVTRGAEVQGLVDRYGAIALAIAALTPIPYSLACWACGAGGMAFWRFLLVSQLRIFRVAGYLYLIDAGILQGVMS